LMNDELGPSTGCSGNLIWACLDSCRLVNEGVAKVEDICVKEGYVGQIDLNAIVSKEDGKLYGLEWTPRFGYDSIPTILQLLDIDLGKLFSDFAKGQVNYEFPIAEGYAGGVRLSIPPYPLEPPKTKDIEEVGPNRGIPIRGIKESNKDKIYFFEIMQGEEEEILHSSGTGAILVASDSSETPEGCFKLPYKILGEAKVPDKQYRTDLDKVLPEMCENVQELEGASINA